MPILLFGADTTTTTTTRMHHQQGDVRKNVTTRNRTSPVGFLLVVAVVVCSVVFLGNLEGRLHLSDYVPSTTAFVQETAVALKEHDNLHVIPKIVHQSWRDDSVPVRGGAGGDYRQWIQSWAGGTCHKDPSWKYIFWTDRDNRELFRKYLPQYLKTYDRIPLPVERADMSRYAYMYVVGGVYADLDFDCLQDFDALLQRKDIRTTGAFISSEPWIQSFLLFGRETMACNAIMGSAPGHPLWLALLDRIAKTDASTCVSRILECTGPVALDEEYRRDDMKQRVTMLSSDYFYPEIAVNNLANMGGKCHDKKNHNDTQIQRACQIIQNYKIGSSLWTNNT